MPNSHMTQNVRDILTVNVSNDTVVKMPCVNFLPRDAMQVLPMWSCGICVSLSVCVPVTFVNSVKTNKHIIKFFSPSGSHTILVFLCQTA